MIYDVRQSTIYHYASPVAYAHHVLRLTPIDREHQRVHAATLDITPTPIERREGQDFFGNRTSRLRQALRRLGKMYAGLPSPAPISRRGRPRIICFRAARCRSIRKFGITPP